MRTRVLLIGLTIGLAVAGIELWLTVRLLQDYPREVSQTLNQDLAAHIAEAKRDLLVRDDRPDSARLDELFHWLMVVNPTAEFYLLGPGGAVLGWHNRGGETLTVSIVDLRPVRRALDGALPILGRDPRSGREKVFSAAPLLASDGSATIGYLYVILESRLHDRVGQAVSQSAVLRRLVWLAGLALAITLGLGVLASVSVTSPLRRLRARVARLDLDSSGTSGSSVPGRRPLRDEIGQLEAALDDLETRLHEQIQLRAAVEQGRRELIANVSHDLRTPLATLRGYLETLALSEESLDGERRTNFLAISLRHAERLSRLVDELFELSRLEAGELELELESVPLAELLHDHAQRMRPLAQARGVALSCTAQEDLPALAIDVGRIERVVENLVGNAIRYASPAGKVEIQARAGSGEVTVIVNDDGEGIAEDQIDRVFDRLYHGNGHHGGTGLGLAISRRIVEAHGGTIEIARRSPHGTTVQFHLPLSG